MTNTQPKIITGQDQYDALCILSRAKTVLLTTASTFSQIGALLGDSLSDVDVHYPIRTLMRPHVTISWPNFKYHLFDDGDKNVSKVTRFNVPHEEITFVESS